MIHVGQQIQLMGCRVLNACKLHNNQWLLTNLIIIGLFAGPCEYSILDSNSEFFVLLELDSDQTLLGPSSEYYKLQDFHDYFNNYSEAAGHGEDISG